MTLRATGSDSAKDPGFRKTNMQTQIDARLSRRTVLATAVATLGLMAAPPFLRAEISGRNDVRAIAFDGAALLIVADGYWRSGDDGTSWSRLTDGGHGPATALATHPDRPGRIHATLAAGGLIRSVDGGMSWKSVGAHLPVGAATALTVAAPAPDTLYLAIQGDGLWRSLDAGDTWEFVMDRPFLGGAEREVLTLASVNGATGMGGIWLYAGTERGITRVPDCFCRWQDVQSGDAMDALAAGTAPTAGNPLPAGESLRSLALAPQIPDVLYAALPSGIWKSTDAGVNWARTGDAVAQCLAVNPVDPNHVVAPAAGGIVFSRDGGATWSTLAAP